MNAEKKSKRQERREKARQKERRNRLITIGLIVVGAAFIVFAFIYPALKPVAQVVAVDPLTHYQPDGNTMGDPNAPIKIVEYSDFQCPYCEHFHQDTEQLLLDYYVKTGKVQFTYRSMGNWVSGNIGGANTESQNAAEAAYCAGDQNKFWEMHDALFGNVLGENVGSFTDKRLQLIAEKVGLNMDEFNSCYNSNKYLDRVQQDQKDGTAVGITGTPGFVVTYTVNGVTKTDRIDGAQPFSAFQVKLEAILNEINS